MKLKWFNVILLMAFVSGIVIVSSAPNDTTISSIQISDLIQAEEAFSTSSLAWSPNGEYLLIRSSKSISMFESINKHYLINMDNKTYGEIDYGITEEESNYIYSYVSWVPSGSKIYFTIIKWGETGGGNCVICDPDGADMRVLGSPNITPLSEAISNLGGRIMYTDLTFSPDSGKVAYEYEDPENFIGSLWIENIDGTNAFELRAKARKLVWYNSTTVYFLTRNGTLMVTDSDGNSIRAFRPPDTDDKYGVVSFSPDKQKMTFAVYTANDEQYNIIANIDGSDLVKSEIGSWQPNGSAMLLNKNGSLYILEGNAHSKHLLYEGNATEPQWFPDGNKILFLENKNQIYSIDADGTNLSFISDIGLTSRHVWETSASEWEQISISPDGDTIAFTSALYPSGELIDLEPSLTKAKNIAAPLFIISSNGTNRTQLTPALKGRYDFLDGWSPDGRALVTASINYGSSDIRGGYTLFSLDGTNLSDGWQEMPVSQIIIGNDNPTQTGNSVQENVKPSLNGTASDTKDNEKSPSFQFLHLVFCIMAMWVLQKKRR
jgi:Tol biopolymer transport system component